MKGFLFAAPLAIVLTAVAAGPAWAQISGRPAPGYRQEPAMPASAMPKALQAIGFDQKLNEQLPLDATFRDEHGRTVALGEYFGRKPVVLAFVYYQCPMLCTQILSSITSTLGVLSLDTGKDFELVMVSFDPRETPEMAREQKATYLKRYSRPEAESGWHFLTGEQASIDRVTAAAGFRYAWDEETQQFAHPSGIVVATPDGRLSRYLFGIDFGPRDLRLAIVEASEGKIGSLVDSVLLYCYHYDPMTGRYGFVVMSALRIAGAATILLVGGFVVIQLRRERKSARRTPAVPLRGTR